MRKHHVCRTILFATLTLSLLLGFAVTPAYNAAAQVVTPPPVEPEPPEVEVIPETGDDEGISAIIWIGIIALVIAVIALAIAMVGRGRPM